MRYVYPVIGRRSRGLSIGVNLSPTAACQFDCRYCCVNRPTAAPSAEVNTGHLADELQRILAHWQDLFHEPEFRDVPADLRRLNDIAFSGDGEPTAAPCFPDALERVIEVRDALGLHNVKIVVITNACVLDRASVRAALARLDANGGELWAKLDAGTQRFFERINRSPLRLDDIVEKILSAARERPIVIQSMFVRLDQDAPPDGEIEAWLARLAWLRSSGGAVREVQVYTLARPAATPGVEPLDAGALEGIAERVRRLGLHAEVYA